MGGRFTVRVDREFLEGLALTPEALEAVLERAQAVETEHENALRQGQLERALEGAVAALGGRNGRAIRALLDEGSILESQDMAAAARQAVGQVKREHSYLFHTPQPGTGTARVTGYSQEELASMSLAEYKRARRG